MSPRVCDWERVTISDQEKYMEHHQLNFPAVPQLNSTYASEHTRTHTDVLCGSVFMGSALEVIMFKCSRLKITEQ